MTTNIGFQWSYWGNGSKVPEFWTAITIDEAAKILESWKPKTRTVVLKEWICWDDDYPETQSVAWRSVDPSDEETNSLVAFDHAHATGNTRTIEIPVT
jgi:hypothetical protein